MFKKPKIEIAKPFTVPLFLCLFIISFSSKGQHSYLQIGLGYGTTFGPGFQPASDSYRTSTGVSTTVTENLSFGKGFQFAGIFGWEWNEFFATECAVSYLLGSTFRSNYTNDIQGNYYSLAETIEGRMLRFVPTVKVFGGKRNLRPYAKAGLILGLGTTCNYSQKIGSNVGGSYQNIEVTGRITGGISYGFMGAFGLDIAINPKYRFFTELAVFAQTYIPEKDIIETYEINKRNYFGSLSTRDKETRFVDEITQQDLNNSNTNSANKQIKIYLPFSSIGLNIGMKFYLNKNSEKTKTE